MATDTAPLLFLSLGGEDRIAVFRQEPTSGLLAHLRDVRVGGTPGCLGPSPDRRRLYVAVRSTESLAAFRIDAATGALDEINRVVSGNAPFVGTDRAGRFLFSAYYQAGRVRVHPLAASGGIGETPTASIDTEKNAHLAVSSPDNRYLYVPHTGPNAIYQFRFDARSGALTPHDPPKVEGAPGSGPRHLRFHRNGKWGYSADEDGSSVTLWALDTPSGRLARLQTTTTLPAGFKGQNTCAEVKLHPTGRWCYVSNRGHDSLAIFRIDPSTGALTSEGHAPTEKTPRSFDLDPVGGFLYAAGEGGSRLAAYRIDAGSGGLSRIDTYEVGMSPSWVELVGAPA